MKKSNKIWLICSVTLLILSGAGAGAYFGITSAQARATANQAGNTEFQNCLAETVSNGVQVSSSSTTQEQVRLDLNNQRIEKFSASSTGDICLLGNDSENQDLYYKFATVEKKQDGPSQALTTPLGSTFTYNTILYTVSGKIDAQTQAIISPLVGVLDDTMPIGSQIDKIYNDTLAAASVNMPNNNSYCFIYNPSNSTKLAELQRIRGGVNTNATAGININLTDNANVPQNYSFNGTSLGFVCFTSVFTNTNAPNALPQVATPDQVGLVPGKAKVSIRDYHSISCDPELQKTYYNRTDKTTQYENFQTSRKWLYKDKESLRGIYCFVLDKNKEVSNNFPYFYFDDVASSLLNLNKIDDATLKLSNGEFTNAAIAMENKNTVEVSLGNTINGTIDTIKKYYLTVNDAIAIKIRENAKLVTSEILNQASSNNEMALLDSVIIGEQSSTPEYNSKGLYQSVTGISTRVDPTYNFHNRTEIRLSLDRTIYQTKKLSFQGNSVSEIDYALSDIFITNAGQGSVTNPILSRIDSFTSDADIPDTSPIKNSTIAFDIFSIIETFNHEFGHHQASYTREFTVDDDLLINKLKEFFTSSSPISPEEMDRNTRVADFEKIYRYLKAKPSTDATEVLGTENNRIVNYVPEDDDETLQLLRKYQDTNVKSIYEITGIDSTAYNAQLLSQQENFINRIYLGPDLNEVNNMSSPPSPSLPNEIKVAIAKVIDVRTRGAIPNNYQLLPYAQNEANWMAVADLLKDTYWYNFVFQTFTDGLLGNQAQNPNYYYLPKNFLSGPGVSMQRTKGEIFNSDEVIDPRTGTAVAPNSSNVTCANAPVFFNDQSGPYEFTIIGNSNGNMTDEVVNERALANFKYYFSTQELLARLSSILATVYSDNRENLYGCSIEAATNFDGQRTYRQEQRSLSQIAYYDYAFFKTFGMDILALTKEQRIELQNFIQRKTNLNSQTDMHNNEGYIQTQNQFNTNFPYFYSYNQLTADEGEERAVSVYTLLDVKLSNVMDRFKVKLAYGSGEVFSPVEFDYGNRFIIDDNADPDHQHDNLGKSIERETIIEPDSAASTASRYISLAFKIRNLPGPDFQQNPFGNNNLPTVFIDENNNNIQDPNEQVITILNQ